VTQAQQLVFIDTSGFIALWNPDDRNHQKALGYLDQVRESRRRLLTTNFIFAEVYAFFCRNHRLAVELGEQILTNPLFEYVRITAADEARAWEIAKQYTDKDFSFTDCTSFVVMERLGLREVFAFDEHFRQYGKFTQWP
jgi:predicted nucleic acid-binding protein